MINHINKSGCKDNKMSQDKRILIEKIIDDHNGYRSQTLNLSASENISLLGEIPLDQSIREAGDIGRPAALQNTELGSLFIQLSKRVIDSIKSRNENLPTTKKVDITHNRGCN